MRKIFSKTSSAFSGILPWIIFSFLPKHSQLSIDLSVMFVFVCAIFLSYADLKRKFLLPWITILFFGFCLIAIVFLKLNWLSTHTGIVTNLVLALTAWGSLLIGKPFTLQYAKEKTTPDKWHDPIFIFINRFLTIAWGIIFLFALLINIAQSYSPTILLWTNNWLTALTYLFGAWLSVKFPTWYVARIKRNK